MQTYFSQKFRGSYVKSWTTNIFSRKLRDSYIKSMDLGHDFLLNGRAFLQNDGCLADLAVRVPDPTAGNCW
jgi:hypothetical protein